MGMDESKSKIGTDCWKVGKLGLTTPGLDDLCFAFFPRQWEGFLSPASWVKYFFYPQRKDEVRIEPQA